MLMTHNQQERLYDAERGAPTGEWLTEPEATRYVRRVIAQPWFHVRYPVVRHVEVKFVSGERSRGGHLGDGIGAVELVPSGRQELSLIHELAHAVTAATYGSDAHDPLYVRVFLELLARLHPEAYLAVYAGCVREGVEMAGPEDERRLGGPRLMPAAT